MTLVMITMILLLLLLQETNFAFVPTLALRFLLLLLGGLVVALGPPKVIVAVAVEVTGECEWDREMLLLVPVALATVLRCWW